MRRGRVPGGRPAMAGGSAEADEAERRTGVAAAAGAGVGGRGSAARRQPEVVVLAVVCAIATVAFGIYPTRCSTSPATRAPRSPRSSERRPARTPRVAPRWGGGRGFVALD